MSLAIGIGLLIAGLSDRSADTWKKFVRQTLDWILSPKMVLRLSLCVIVIALTTTHSRMGNGAFFASLIIAGIVGIALSRYATRNTVLLLASLVVIDLVIVGSWFGVEKLAKRVQETTVQDVQEREEPPEAAMNLIRDFPVFGAGPRQLLPRFPALPDRKDRLLLRPRAQRLHRVRRGVGRGRPGGPRRFRAPRPWRRPARAVGARDPLMRGMSFACIMGVTAILIHSWVDINLQIPPTRRFSWSCARSVGFPSISIAAKARRRHVTTTHEKSWLPARQASSATTLRASCSHGRRGPGPGQFERLLTT
jgi:hypothetical protein